MSFLRLLFTRLSNCLTIAEGRLLNALGLYPHSSKDCSFILNMNVDQFFPVTSRSQQERIFDIGILWAVPTHRRSVERRLTRKMAIEKRLKPKRNLVMCSSCGHYHEGHTICGNCYETVRKETEEMQAAIQNVWKLEPVEQDVIVVYNGEEKNDSAFWRGKRIVEMKKERPPWFQQNLRVKTINSESKNESSVQPSSTSITLHVK